MAGSPTAYATARAIASGGTVILLTAVATRVASTLATELRAAYVAFVARHRVGSDAVFAPPLRDLADRDLAAAGRAVMDAFAAPAHRLVDDPRAALGLVEQVVALAHGYGTLDAEGFLSDGRFDGAATSERARRAVATLVRAREVPP